MKMKLPVFALLFSLIVDQSTQIVHRNRNMKNKLNCTISEKLINEIQSYKPIAKKIMEQFLSKQGQGFAYDEVKQFVDKFGPRMAGSRDLEESIDYMIKKLKSYDLENVHGETVVIPHWVRGNETVWMLSPRRQKLEILGLGFSAATPPGGIVTEGIVVNSFDDLEGLGHRAKGKIIVFNEDFVSYPETVKYRTTAAARAAKYGAAAVLVRSITPFSLYTPHTGMQNYEKEVPNIPAAAITVEDAHLLARLQASGNRIILKLTMREKTFPHVESRNIVADITGRKIPDKTVIVSGHIDSWDVGQGALDDGGGAFISWGALAILRRLHLRPRRTLRAVLWTAEEIGLLGAAAYFHRHQNQNDNLTLLLESDEGTFTPLGLQFHGSDGAACILQEILRLLKPINATKLERSNDVGSDITLWKDTDVPQGALLTKNDKYFWYHHTNADTMDALNSEDLDKCTAVWATVAYVVADLSVELPRN